jgi:hypothetical protein
MGQQITFQPLRKNFRDLECFLQIRCGRLVCWYVPKIDLLEAVVANESIIPQVVWIPEVKMGELESLKKHMSQLVGSQWVIGKMPEAYFQTESAGSLWILSQQGAFRLVLTSGAPQD